MRHVLQVMGSTERGGAQTFVMNVFRSIDREKVLFDFYTANDRVCEYDDEITSLGGIIYHAEHVNSRSRIVNLISIYKRDKAFFNKHPEIEIVHVHTNSAVSLITLAAAKSVGINKRIIHSHSTNTKHRAFHFIFRPFIKLFATDTLACGKEAGVFLYGSSFDENNIIPNSIDVNRFTFDENNRNNKREELGLQNCLVIGHIGRFEDVKNHRFLIDVFAKILEARADARLVLIGTGSLLSEMKSIVKERQLQDKVFFLGDRSDVSYLLSAMDMMIFPSLHEGIPLTLLEAQANGLPIFSSDRVAIESIVTPLYYQLSLKDNADTWKEQILVNWNAIDKSKRIKMKDYLLDSKYDINFLTKKIDELYNLDYYDRRRGL